MNRYRSGGPSKASATTLCQKCLKRGHYSYECSAAEQQRPYTSRPSRTQQLLNPKLAPKITTVGVTAASPQSNTTAPAVDTRKRGRDVGRSPSPARKRPRSASLSSASIATISTRSSQSPAPLQEDRPSQGRDSARSGAMHRGAPTVKASARPQSDSTSSSISDSTSPQELQQRSARHMHSRSTTQDAEAARRRTSASHATLKDNANGSLRQDLSPYSQRLAFSQSESEIK